MFHRLAFLVFVLLVIIALPAIDRAAAAPRLDSDTVSPSAVDAAQAGLHRFLDLIPPGEAKHFGFIDRTELSLAHLGAPFMIYTLMADDILALEDPGDVLPEGLEKLRVRRLLRGLLETDVEALAALVLELRAEVAVLPLPVLLDLRLDRHHRLPRRTNRH